MGISGLGIGCRRDTRIAALALARESRVGIVEGLRFGGFKWPQYFLAALLPLAGVVVTGVHRRSHLWTSDAHRFRPARDEHLLAADPRGEPGDGGHALGAALRLGADVADDQRRRDRFLRRFEPFLFVHISAASHYLFYVVVAGIIGLLAAYIVTYFVAATTELAFWSASWGAGAHARRRDPRRPCSAYLAPRGRRHGQHVLEL